MANQEVPVWIRIERPGVNLNSSRIFCSRDQILVDLIDSAVVKLPSASSGIDASFLRPQDADGNALDLDMAVSSLPLGQSLSQPLRLVCDIPLPGVCPYCHAEAVVFTARLIRAINTQSLHPSLRMRD
jgi:hypothetical protein